MKLQVTIVLNGNNVTAHYPENQRMHALKMLESARQIIEGAMLRSEAEPAIAVPESTDQVIALLRERGNGNGRN